MAILDRGGVPLYSQLKWSGKMRDGREIIEVHSPACNVYHSLSGERGLAVAVFRGDDSDRRREIILTERGIECAEYLKRREIKSRSGC